MVYLLEKYNFRQSACNLGCVHLGVSETGNALNKARQTLLKGDFHGLIYILQGFRIYQRRDFEFNAIFHLLKFVGKYTQNGLKSNPLYMR